MKKTKHNNYFPDPLDQKLFDLLYKLKILSLQQCWQTVYYAAYSDFMQCFWQHLYPMYSAGLIVIFPNVYCKYAVMLTNKGIAAMSIEADKHASDLAVEEKQIPHHLSLVQFLLDFQSSLDSSPYNHHPCSMNIEVYDRDYELLRPDAVITLSGILFFIEQDMGTEDVRQLRTKWIRYRRFLENQKGSGAVPEMILLFIVTADEKVCYKRQKTVLDSLQLLSPAMARSDIKIYVGTESEILHTVFEVILPSLFSNSLMREILQPFLITPYGYTVSETENLNSYLSELQFDFYLRKATKESSDSPFPDAFLFQDGRRNETSAIAKVSYLDKANALIRERVPDARYLPLMILTDDTDRTQLLLRNEEAYREGKVFVLTEGKLYQYAKKHLQSDCYVFCRRFSSVLSFCPEQPDDGCCGRDLLLFCWQNHS